ncbi:MAG TPA: restriction endonuclease subunit S [Ferruginibacter sp.]|nr:restriction endonuclease subunit S [Ferruginibacter sp.]
MSEWKKCKLGDVITFQRGHDLPKTKMVIGTFPVAGSNGIIGFHNKATTKGPGVTIGRSGNIGTPVFYSKDYWAHNTVLYIKDFKDSSPKFIYYFLNTFDFSQFNAGSAVPTLNRNHIHELNVTIPEKPEQIQIASILSSLDDKIDLLQRQNKTLEQLAETLFRQWFLEEVEESWEVGKLGDIAALFNGKSRPKEVVNGSIPVYGGNGILGFTDKSNYSGVSIIIGRVGAYCGSLYLENREIWVSDNALLTKPRHDDCPYFLFYLLKSLHLNSMAEGSSHPLLTQTLLNSIEIIIPPKEKIFAFDFQAKEFWNKINYNQIQIRTLTQLRDTLLPKLMSGEVRVI